MASAIPIFLIMSASMLLGWYLAYAPRKKKNDRILGELNALKETFSCLEEDHQKLSLFANSIQKQKEQYSKNNLELRQIVQSLELNISQLEKDRQGIINAFNTYKSQTIAAMRKDLDEVRNSNLLWISRYKELLEQNEEKNSLAIDLARDRDHIREQFHNFQERIASTVNGKKTVENLKNAYEQLKSDYASQRELLLFFREKYTSLLSSSKIEKK